MPEEMDGADHAWRIAQAAAGYKFVFVSGYAEDAFAKICRRRQLASCEAVSLKQTGHIWQGVLRILNVTPILSLRDIDLAALHAASFQHASRSAATSLTLRQFDRS